MNDIICFFFSLPAQQWTLNISIFKPLWFWIANQLAVDLYVYSLKCHLKSSYVLVSLGKFRTIYPEEQLMGIRVWAHSSHTLRQVSSMFCTRTGKQAVELEISSNKIMKVQLDTINLTQRKTQHLPVPLEHLSLASDIVQHSLAFLGHH